MRVVVANVPHPFREGAWRERLLIAPPREVSPAEDVKSRLKGRTAKVAP